MRGATPHRRDADANRTHPVANRSRVGARVSPGCRAGVARLSLPWRVVVPSRRVAGAGAGKTSRGRQHRQLCPRSAAAVAIPPEQLPLTVLFL
jgi:hypothetical protein